MTLEISANFPSPAHASINGKNFLGSWSAKRVYDEALAKKYRLLGTEASERYMNGSSKEQSYQGQATLKDQDGMEMQCKFRYRGAVKAGDCSVNGNIYSFAGY